MTTPSLLPFFSPRGIVVIGASTSPEKLGYGVARNLIHCGYQGAVHFVGQKPDELFGCPLHTSVRQVPNPVDLAILIVPPHGTPEVIEECGARGIKAAIIMSSGFREVGEAGAALEKRCLEIAHIHGIRLIGPNCIGTIDTHLPLDTTFLPPPMPARGHIGFISHSGAFCAAIIDWARGQGFGFSRIVSLGNQVDVNETDALTVLGDDENTHVIVLYMEGVADGRRFVEIAGEITRRKPVIALKVGRFEAGQKAAASHTGALAASDNAFEAAFKRAGILRADSAEEMFDWATVLQSHPEGLRQTNKDPGIAILTNAGGPGVIAADALENNGLALAKLHETTIQTLQAGLPPAANVFNPVDMLASASPDTYAKCLKILLEDNNVDGVLVILPPPPMYQAGEVAEKLIGVMESISKPIASLRKPVVVALLGSTLIEEALTIFRRGDIPTYPFPERAASALGALLRRAGFVDDRPAIPPASAASADPMVHQPSSMVNPSPEELLDSYYIPIASIKLARSIEEAKTVGSALGYPIVMKIASPDISHKSDVGGVILNIQDVSSLMNAYTQMMLRVREAKPEARIEGVHLQRQIPQGQEVIVGAVRDPQFGPLMMFGSGGVEVEGLRDVAFALAPLSREQAQKLIRRTWAGRKLAGFRNIPPADEESVVEVVVRLSQLVMENEGIDEIEINPLRALARGAVAVDVRIKPHGTR
jgi:acetate---CoA ligase (ADP-forming)